MPSAAESAVPACIKPGAAAGKQFVNVRLVAYIKDEPVGRSVEDVVHSQRQFDDAEVWAQMAARLRQYEDQLLAYFLSQCLQFRHGKALDIRGRVNRIE
jgi:hypothetical protein